MPWYIIILPDKTTKKNLWHFAEHIRSVLKRYNIIIFFLLDNVRWIILPTQKNNNSVTFVGLPENIEISLKFQKK